MISATFLSLILCVRVQQASDTEILRSVADKVISSYKVEYRTEDNGEIHCTNKYFNWNYSTGILNSAMIELAALTGDRKYADYAKMQVDYCLANWMKFSPVPGKTDWQPFYGLRRFNELDFVGTQCGALMDIEDEFGTDEYEPYIQKAAEHIRHGQERLSDGTLVRDTPKNLTLWADDLHMGLSFLVRYAVKYKDPAMLADAVVQVRSVNERLWDNDRKLFWHAWYSENSQHAGAFWGRANGWILKAVSELLEALDPSSAEYEEVLGYYRRQVDGLKAYQSENGMWRQVIDDSSSYQESSCTALFAGAVAKGVRHGWLGPEYASIARRAWKELKNSKIVDGEIYSVCIGTGILASPADYAGRRCTDGDIHGVGLVLGAGMEIAKMLTIFVPDNKNR